MTIRSGQCPGRLALALDDRSIVLMSSSSEAVFVDQNDLGTSDANFKTPALHSLPTMRHL